MTTPQPAPPRMSLRHLALRVTDLVRSRDFYLRLFGMSVVWAPDDQNVYLSCGDDNLALHQIAAGESLPRGGALDHLGFVVADPSAVDQMWQVAQAAGATIIHPLRHHRDGSYSFYFSDPDGNVIQILHEPRVCLDGASLVR